MQTIEIKITPEGKKRLEYYVETALTGGHWGSSDIEIPDEQALAYKIRVTGGTLELSVRECRLLLNWFGESTDDGRFLLPEDAELIIVIREAIEMYLKRLEQHYRSERGDADVLARIISRILPVNDEAATRIADAVIGPAKGEIESSGIREEGQRDENVHSSDHKPVVPKRISFCESIATDIKNGLKKISGIFSRRKNPEPAFQYENIDDIMARSRRLAKKVSKK